MSKELIENAAAMVAYPKGILAADESSPTLTKRFAVNRLESTALTRRDWRETLFSSPGLGEYVSGVILYDETFNQTTTTGLSFPDFLADLGMLPGIKVDTGAKPLAGADGELVTEGLDNLGPRLIDYYAKGARFAKWRAVLQIDRGKPSAVCIQANTHALARYAKLCQESGIVPIVEPEILMEGDHDLAMTSRVAKTVLAAVFDQLRSFDVTLSGMVLKPSMITPGTNGPTASPKAIAEASVECYRDVVPASVAGIALLSGGQSDEAATANLAAMNEIEALPWPITFSFGRALQDTPMKVWASSGQDRQQTQTSLMTRITTTASVLRPRHLISV
ncbi:class I fructose-bisphosphate aldolase [Ferrimicrobium sp.]|uniref:class I fructose-bisphosphate aldolase n=1 Tax=Ferrimicrobium sp. TaxID=2926050 RepID=UPI0026271D38|nr:class I fructose-bisphosphate aldolase [Ferrimicrobium sp.]